MIDFIKVVYTHENISAFIERHNQTMKGVFNLGSGEISYPFTFKFEEYSICIRYSDSKNVHFIEITGSPHKNHFKGANFDRFTFQDLQFEVNQLCQSLELDPGKLYIQNLEIGINIITPFAPYQYLKDNLLLYSTKPFKHYKKGKDGKELGYYCEGSPIVKLYDKGKQYNLPHNLMRFEIRFKKSKRLHDFGIQTLNDLLNPVLIQKLSSLLLETWSNVLLYESDLNVKTSSLNDKEKRFYEYCEHAKNWLKTLSERLSRTSFYKQKIRFRKIITKHGKNVHHDLYELIKMEIEKCTNFPPLGISPVYKITDTLNSKTVHLVTMALNVIQLKI